MRTVAVHRFGRSACARYDRFMHNSVYDLLIGMLE